MDYIGRDVWEAQYDAGFGARALPCQQAWLHHTVTKQLAVDATVYAEREQMRVIERIGQSRFGKGFSYNLAIFPSGRVYVGCGVSRVGSHTAKRNTIALGIVLVGNYQDNEVSDEMYQALVGVLRDADRLGWLPSPRLDGGHRDLKATSCPGAHAYDLIGQVNNAAARPYQPAPTPEPEPEPELPVEESMARLIKTPSEPEVWATDGLRRWHVPSQVELADLRNTGIYGDGVVHVVSPQTVAALPLR